MYISLQSKLPQLASVSLDTKIVYFGDLKEYDGHVIEKVYVFGTITPKQIQNFLNIKYLWVCFGGIVVINNYIDFSFFHNLMSVGGAGRWDVSRMTDMSSMFYNSKIKDFGFVKHWDVSQVNDMLGMFATYKYDDTITKVNIHLRHLRYWDVSNVRYMDKIFRDCEIPDADLHYIHNWTSYAFENCGLNFPKLKWWST